MKDISLPLLSVISFLTLLPSLAFTQTPVPVAYNVTETTLSPNTTPSPRFTPNLTIAADLSKSVDARKNRVGDKVEARTSMDLLAHGQIVLPRNTRILGHVTSIAARSKDSPESAVGIIFDSVLLKDGHLLPLKASLQAIGAPIDRFEGYESISAMVGNGLPPIDSRNNGSPASMRSYNSPTLDDPFNTMEGRLVTGHSPAATGLLPQGMSGIFGLKDLSVSISPEANLFSSKLKNVHLDSGTQLILRTQ